MMHENLKVKDNLSTAIDYLVLFSKRYCIDLKMSEALNEPSYRCKNCQFSLENVCMMKLFVHAHGTQKQIGDLHNNLIPDYIYYKRGETDEL